MRWVYGCWWFVMMVLLTGCLGSSDDCLPDWTGRIDAISGVEMGKTGNSQKPYSVAGEEIEVRASITSCADTRQAESYKWTVYPSGWGIDWGSGEYNSEVEEVSFDPIRIMSDDNQTTVMIPHGGDFEIRVEFITAEGVSQPVADPYSHGYPLNAFNVSRYAPSYDVSSSIIVDEELPRDGSTWAKEFTYAADDVGPSGWAVVSKADDSPVSIQWEVRLVAASTGEELWSGNGGHVDASESAQDLWGRFWFERLRVEVEPVSYVPPEEMVPPYQFELILNGGCSENSRWC